MTAPSAGLTMLESVVSTGIGIHASEAPLPEIEADLDPLIALERVVMRGLRRPPCLVSFSGGRDSSAVLAVATVAARREGLPLPIPSTRVFPTYPDTHESGWQELVVKHLGLPGWNRQTFGSELNFLGPVAERVIRRHGLIGPAGIHDLVPTLEQAAHGSVLTGLGGDGLFSGGGGGRIRSVLGRQTRPVPRDILRLGNAAAPRALRRALLARREYRGAIVPWVRRDAADALRTALAGEQSTEPPLWRDFVTWYARLRANVVVRDALARLAADTDTLLLHPLLDPTVLAALAQRGGALGYGDRSKMMDALFGELLPPAVLTRADKADFTAMFWSGETRAFISSWDGTGVPEAMVDPEALRREWSGDAPDARSAFLLQLAWGAASGIGRRDHALHRSA